MYDSLI